MICLNSVGSLRPRPYNALVNVALTDSPRVLARPDHLISRRSIDVNAIKVLYRLHRSGFKGYMVGGAVRDLMLDRVPKDFDVSSDARPQQIRRLFRNSRIIGRRFRLVHVYFRQGIVEVSTFRGNPDPGAQKSAPGERLITNDNVFGSPSEDASRRDFTVNALFYDISDFSVIDYVGGIDDLNRRLIRTIGDPDLRFCEDPVRMLRACELAGRLDFQIDGKTKEAIVRQSREIAKAAAPRLNEEIVQILRTKKAAAILDLACEYELLGEFLPEADQMIRSGNRNEGGFKEVPVAIDGLVASGRELSPTALLGSLLLPRVLDQRRKREEGNQRPLRRGAQRALIQDQLAPFAAKLALPRQRSWEIGEGLSLFFRLGESWKNREEQVRFATRAVFDDALDMLEIMTLATGGSEGTLSEWKAIQRNRPKIRRKSVARKRPQRRRRRRPR